MSIRVSRASRLSRCRSPSSSANPRQENLDRHRSAALQIVGGIDDAERPAAHLALDAISLLKSLSWLHRRSPSLAPYVLSPPCATVETPRELAVANERAPEPTNLRRAMTTIHYAPVAVRDGSRMLGESCPFSCWRRSRHGSSCRVVPGSAIGRAEPLGRASANGCDGARECVWLRGRRTEQPSCSPNSSVLPITATCGRPCSAAASAV